MSGQHLEYHRTAGKYVEKLKKYEKEAKGDLSAYTFSGPIVPGLQFVQ